MTMPSQFSINTQQMQSFIANNNMIAAQAAVAAASNTVPVSIFRVGDKNKQPTPILAQAMPVPRLVDTSSMAANTPKEDEFEWLEYFDQNGKPYYHNRITKVTQWAKPDRYKPGAQTAANSAQKVSCFFENFWTFKVFNWY